MLTPKGKSPLPIMSPEEDRTRDAVDSEPKHYQLSYSGPQSTCFDLGSLLSMKTECVYLNGWIEKRSHMQKSHPKW